MIGMLALLAGLALLVGTLVLGGSGDMFWHAGSAMLVLLGTLSVSAIGLDGRDLARLKTNFIRLCTGSGNDFLDGRKRLMDISARIRRDGVRVAEPIARGLGAFPFLKEGVQLVGDGLSPAQVEELMTARARQLAADRLTLANYLRRAAATAPAMGLVGTLVGLIRMMQNLDAASALGPGMALALLTTLYGTVLAYMVLSPIAERAEAQVAAEQDYYRMVIAGLCAVARGDHPMHLESRLDAFTPRAA